MSCATRASSVGFDTQLAVSGVPAQGGLGGSGRIGGRTYPGPSGTRTFLQILGRPQRLEVRVVARLKELSPVRQVKRSQRFDMINVPTGPGPILPDHPRLELQFQVSLQLFDRAAKVSNGRAGPTALPHTIPNPSSEIRSQPSRQPLPSCLYRSLVVHPSAILAPCQPTQRRT